MIKTLGHAPSGWKAFTLGDLFDFSNGINAEKSAYGHGTPFVNVLEVITNYSLDESLIPGRIGLPQSFLSRFRVQRGDVLFNRTSETQDEVGLSSTYLGTEPIVFGGFVLRGHPKTAELAISYSKYALRCHLVRVQIIARGQGGIRANIGQRDLKTVQLTIPPVPEQESIASALDDASGAIATLERLIAKKEAVKQGMMQQLLTGRTRLPGFESPWSARRLSELLSYEQPGRFLVRTAQHLDSGRVPVLTAGKTFLLGYTNDTDGIYTAHPVIIFDDFTTASQYVDFDFKAKSSAMKILSAKTGVNLRFVHERMQLIDFPLGDHKRYWISEYSQQVLLVPSEEEQKAIADVLTQADLELATVRRRLNKAKSVKQGMMQELLTGRIRLPAEDVVPR
jgi:type I restriction enzyme S subunit